MLRGEFPGYYVLHCFTAILMHSLRQFVFSSLNRNYLWETGYGAMSVDARA